MPRCVKSGTHFQSAALPTELPGRAMQQNNLAGSGGRWQWECLPLVDDVAAVEHRPGFQPQSLQQPARDIAPQGDSSGS